jgi:hypothetical protein
MAQQGKCVAADATRRIVPILQATQIQDNRVIRRHRVRTCQDCRASARTRVPGIPNEPAINASERWSGFTLTGIEKPLQPFGLKPRFTSSAVRLR